MRRHFIFYFFILFFVNSANAQQTDIVLKDSIVYDIHKENIGKIIFFEKVTPLENFKEKDFLNSFEIKEKCDLNIRVFLSNSLTNYLHALAPMLSVEDLTKNGNYQFSFYVDDKKVYVENLNVGAGSVDSKNKRTVFRVPFISSTNEDSWGRFLWNRFLMNGGQDVLTSGNHVLKVELRVYVKTTEILVSSIIAKGQLIISIPENRVDEKLVKIQEIKPLPDWSISNEKIDVRLFEELNRKIVGDTFKDITSIVVIKNGELLLEEYFNGAKRNTLHNTRSVGKSFASTLLGIAIDEHFIKGEEQMLGAFYNLQSYANYSNKKNSISLKSLLTMSSAFNGSDINQESPGNEENMYPTKNWVEFTLNLPVDSAKIIKPKWDYFTAGVVVIGDILNKSVPNGLEKYAHQKLFKPMGITHYKWEHTPQKVANTAGGLRMRAIDYAKYGQLYINNGAWNGAQLLSQNWVTKTLSKQIEIRDGEYYGYLFWNKKYLVDNVSYEAYYSSGNGGNKIFIFKEQGIVVVITSTAFNKPYGHSQVDKMMENYILPGVIKSIK